MRDRNAFVTRDVTGESQYPVPTRPNPTRPALYIDRGDFASCRPVSDARAATTASTQPTTSPDAMMTMDLDAEPTCETTYVDGECPNPADFVVRSHLTPHFLLCAGCWAAEAEARGRCVATGCVEGRDEHYRIVQVLR